ncbi:protein of unassigned function [Methylobacterium oryzae CBMB20]|uniref:Protein of unassigned function n=1 Tax=Methylobacterium oryzae CBMB20 TaxID=693986 RepID=A0A089NUJ9_9HYPH|nr:protein of unassigned function [Methylobacterium oryzae CBMB20]
MVVSPECGLTSAITVQKQTFRNPPAATAESRLPVRTGVIEGS